MSIFNSVKSVAKGRNTFTFHPQRMLSCEMGQLVPCYMQENIMPGTRVKISMAELVRFQALLAPLQHNVRAFVHFWYVPYRLIDPSFTEFITGKNMRDGNEYDPPYFTYKDLCDCCLQNGIDPRKFIQSGRLLDFLGYPIPRIFDSPDFNPESDGQWDDMDMKFNVRRLLAYCEIIRQKYINQNVTNDVVDEFFMQLDAIVYGSGDVYEYVYNLLTDLTALTDSGCFPHAWWKDYFTSALPFVQVGDPVSISLGGTAPVSINSDATAGTIKQTLPAVDPAVGLSMRETVVSGADELNQFEDRPQGLIQAWTDEHGGVHTEFQAFTSAEIADFQASGSADLSEATAITIAELRVGFAMQSLREAFARFGSRLQEWSLGFWKTMPTDASIQIPQWLGGGQVPIAISDIEQKAPSATDAVTGDGTPLGTLAGKGVGFGAFSPVDVYCREPGIIMGLLFIQPDTLYSNQGVDRFLLKRNNYFDYINPKTEHIGEQELLNAELNYSNDGNDNREAFGYTARYAEYKMMKSEIHGQFASYLNFWHMARIFNDTPRLNPAFIYTQQEDVKRPFAVQSIEVDGNSVNIDNCLVWLKFKVKMSARYSRYGTPQLLG